MNHNSIFIVILCFMGFSITVLNAGAQELVNPSAWIHTYICDKNGNLTISDQDLQAILNLLYLSFDRSRITLEASENGIQGLSSSWQAFQNIIQLRRNPSKHVPYSVNKDSYMYDIDLLYDLQREHSRIGQTYATAVDVIVHGPFITNPELKKGITALRDDARRAITQALTNVQEYLESILHIRTDEDGGNKAYCELIHKNFNVGDFVWALMPNLAINSFVKADDLTIKVSEEWWKALFQLLTISNMIWKPIERARAELYLTYYKTIYREAQEHSIDMKSMTLMFHEHGMIDPEDRHTQLPDPSILHVPA